MSPWVDVVAPEVDGDPEGGGAGRDDGSADGAVGDGAVGDGAVDDGSGAAVPVGTGPSAPVEPEPHDPLRRPRGELGEPRWPMALAVLATGFLRAALPPELRAGDSRWLYLVVVAVLLGVLIVGDPGRIDRDKRWLRVTTVSLIGLISAANAIAAVKLVIDILDTTQYEPAKFTNNAHILLVSGGAIWLTNVIAFGLWYWDVDGGGAAARARGPVARPAFVFPEMVNPSYVAAGWYPTLRGLPPPVLPRRHRVQPHRRLGRPAVGQAHDDGRGGHLPHRGPAGRGPGGQHSN